MSHDILNNRSPHPARQASINSIEAVQGGDRQRWLSLWHPQGCLEDPVGVSPMDPEGNGHHGIDAIAAFWDTVIGPANLTITAHKRVASGDRACAVSMTALNDLGNGIKTSIDMIAVYETDKAGKICSMKAYWDWDELAGQLARAGLA